MWNYFEEEVAKGLLAKIDAGIDGPNFPQFSPRDMILMFLEMFDGVERSEGGFVLKKPIEVRPGNLLIPEIRAIKRRANDICERAGIPRIDLKLCLTGPYVLSSVFSPKIPRSWLIEELGKALAHIARANVLKEDKVSVGIVSLDEPTLGIVDDPLLDVGSPTRQILLQAWDGIFSTCKLAGATTCVHLHSTANPIFWELGSLDVVESHIGDPIYGSRKSRSMLEKTGMLLKASIARTQPDDLIKLYLAETPDIKGKTVEERMGAVWRSIQRSEMDPIQLVEPEDLLVQRLIEAVQLFGEKVRFAGPECGLGPFWSFPCAIECLRRTASAVRRVNELLRSSGT